MELDSYIEEIGQVCSKPASKEVLDRMLERDTSKVIYNQLHVILSKVVGAAQAEYRQQMVSAWGRALEPFTQGMIEKLMPKPDMPRIPTPLVVGGIFIPRPEENKPNNFKG
jgi:hypothetical protein